MVELDWLWVVSGTLILVVVWPVFVFITTKLIVLAILQGKDQYKEFRKNGIKQKQEEQENINRSPTS